MTENSVQGFVADGFIAVREACAENLASGADVGASCCGTLCGETVVDLWGGFADEEKMRHWQKDTILNVYSTSKTMTALTALLLVNRGEVDFGTVFHEEIAEPPGADFHIGLPASEDARVTAEIPAVFAYTANKIDRLPLNDPRPFRAIRAFWKSLGIGGDE
jgi:CubicO group peptidase (beta-lactamase class C family)